ncbi:MAG: hypothetical protein QXP38_13535, partial [Nitrososphaerota archaeon]
TVLSLNRSTSTVSEIQQDPSNSSEMWALVDGGLTYPNIFISSDFGNSWSPLNFSSVGIRIPTNNYTNPGHSLSYYPQYFTFDPANGSYVYIGGDGYFYRSTDGGRNFSEIQNTGGDVRFISVDPYNDSIVFEGSDQGVIVSLNKGITWEDLNNRSASLVYDVAVDGGHIFATMQDFSPLVSNDSGNSWRTIYRGELGFVSVDPYNKSIVIMWTEQHANGPFFYVSNDGGNSFFHPQVNYSALASEWVSSTGNVVAFTPSAIFIPGGDGIFVSNDGGSSWQLLNNSPKHCSYVVDSPSNPNILYAGGLNGLFKSSNLGESWIQINNIPYPPDSVAIDPLNSSIVAASLYFVGYGGIMSSGRLVISYNGGETFQYTGITSTSRFSSPPEVYFVQRNSNVYLIYTSNQGLFISADFGKHWLSLNYNIETPDITSLFVGSNGSAYVSTYGSGIWYDPSLFNLSFYVNVPLLTFYISNGLYVSIDGQNYSKAGYYSIKINNGENTIEVKGLGKVYLNASAGHIYFENFSRPLSSLIVNDRGLPPLSRFFMSIGQKEFEISNGTNILLTPRKYNYSVYNAGSDYSVMVPTNGAGTVNASSLFGNLTINFVNKSEMKIENLTNDMHNILWATSTASHDGIIAYVGGGDLLLLNTSNMEVLDAGSPFPGGQAYTVTAYGNGFLIGGSSNSTRPGIEMYNITTGLFTNFTALLPETWKGPYASISNIFAINNTSFGFIGGATGQTYFGIVNNDTFYNLTPYLPDYFITRSGELNSFCAAYLSQYDAIVISNGNDAGIFYMRNDTYQDISSILPNQFYIGIGFTFVISHAFISSDGKETMIIGSTSSLQPFVGLYSPKYGFRNISYIIPPNEFPDSVTYNGKYFIIGLLSENSSSPGIIIFNPITDGFTTVNTNQFGNFSVIDSSILVNNTLFFTTFNVKVYPQYDVLSSYYGDIALKPTGEISLDVNVPSTVNIGNQTYYGSSILTYEFSGYYNITVSSPGYKNYNSIIYVSPFTISMLNITLTPSEQYSVDFTESGLPSGTLWSVTLNGSKISSTSSTIVFNETNGTYHYVVGTISGYSSSPYSGNVTISGSPKMIEVIFTQITYPVVFNEEGLPPGTVWSVTINGKTIIDANNITFNEPNGSYSFFINNSAGFTASPQSGTVIVNGSPVIETITFVYYLYMTGTITPSNATLY